MEDLENILRKILLQFSQVLQDWFGDLFIFPLMPCTQGYVSSLCSPLPYGDSAIDT